MKSKQRSYQAFLKRAKADYGLTHRKAQVMYRKVSERLGEPAKAKDLKAHPRIAKQEAQKSQRSRIGGVARKAPSKPPAPPSPLPKRGGGGEDGAAVSITSLKQYHDLYDDFDFYDWADEFYAGGVDYAGEE
jgi:hypothetical protein